MFECMEEEDKPPKFGFRTLITLVDQEPCILGVTCTIDGRRINANVSENDNTNGKNNLSENEQQNSQFTGSEKFKWTDSGFTYLKRKRRQTGEKININASTPSCRLNLDESLDESCSNNKP